MPRTCWAMVQYEHELLLPAARQLLHATMCNAQGGSVDEWNCMHTACMPGSAGQTAAAHACLISWAACCHTQPRWRPPTLDVHFAHATRHCCHAARRVSTVRLLHILALPAPILLGCILAGSCLCLWPFGGSCLLLSITGHPRRSGSWVSI